MSRLTTSSIVLSGFFALSLVGLASSAQAGMASSLMQCKGSNEGQVLSCCNAVIRKSGEKPAWWMQAGGRCGSSAAICVGGGSAQPLTRAVAPRKRCYFNQILLLQDGDGQFGRTRRSSPNRR